MTTKLDNADVFQKASLYHLKITIEKIEMKNHED